MVKPEIDDLVPNRQDLETWAVRNFIIGDHKFKWIYRFLTHPETFGRPEFQHAAVLLNPHSDLLRLGRALAEICVSISESNNYSSENSKEISERLSGVQGVYEEENGEDGKKY